MTQNKLRIDTGIVTVEVNDNGDEISFTPDVLFIERFYDLYDTAVQKADEFKRREKEIAADKAVDGNGMPTNRREYIALIKEACLFFQEEIDGLFGADTCKKALGNVLKPECYIALLEGVMPFIQDARRIKTNKYAKK